MNDVTPPERPPYMRRVYDDLNEGKQLDDIDVQNGVQHFRHLHQMLSELGPAFRLPASEAKRVYDALVRLKDARKREMYSGSFSSDEARRDFDCRR